MRQEVSITRHISGDPSAQKPSTQRIVTRKVTNADEECYYGGHRHRGICLILEHDEFKPSLQLSERKGSEVDLKAANATFSKLGFEVMELEILNRS